MVLKCPECGFESTDKDFDNGEEHCSVWMGDDGKQNCECWECGKEWKQ